MKTILILSGVPYSWQMKQRPQHMTEYFAQKGYKVIYLGDGENSVTLPYDQLEHLSLLQILNNFSTEISENIFVLQRIYTTLINKKSNLNRLILKITNCINPEKLTIFVEHPNWVDELDNINPNIKLIYDCIDDWEGFATDLNFGIDEKISQKERKLASIANLVLVSAKRLYAKMCNYNNNVYYLPNGVWNDDYKEREITKTPPDIEKIENPIIFFMGGIAGWVDLDLISFLASNRPLYSFVFVGDTVGCKLPDLDNIYFLGKKKYDELGSYLKNARVAIIPFKETNLTACVTPLKYYEYMSAGIPVVSTMLPDLVHLPGSKIVQDSVEFLSALDYYVYMNNKDYEDTKSLARKTSKEFDWNKLLEPLCNYIDEEQFILPEKESFIEDTISNYELLNNNHVIESIS